MAVDAGAPGPAEGADEPSTKRRAYDNVSGKVSGRPWKASFGRASSAGSLPPPDWDAKMRAKSQKKAIQARTQPRAACRRARARRTLTQMGVRRLAAGAQAHVAGIKKEQRDAAVAEKKRRAEVKTRREANRKASQVVQKVRRCAPRARRSRGADARGRRAARRSRTPRSWRR